MGYRLIQVFLSTSPTAAIFEVNAQEDKTLVCSCPGFASRSKCKHVSLVASRIDMNSGIYPFNWLIEVSEQDIKFAMNSEVSFRDFIIQSTKVEVL
jgi:hypothetical protein